MDKPTPSTAETEKYRTCYIFCFSIGGVEEP